MKTANKETQRDTNNNYVFIQQTDENMKKKMVMKEVDADISVINYFFEGGGGVGGQTRGEGAVG